MNEIVKDNMADEIHFQIAYDGEILRDNSMEVRYLAPALLSLGQLFEESNRALNQDKATVHLKVIAKSPGSFAIDFSLYQQAIDILSNQQIIAALDLYQLLFVGRGIYTSLMD